MRPPNALRALAPVWFRFTDSDDAGKYGDRWYCYDEGALMRKRGRALLELENDLGMPLPAAMNGFRESSTLGELAVSWLGVHEIDPARAGEFDEYNPIVNMIQWTADDPEPVGKDEKPEPTPERPASGSPTTSDSPSMTSAPTDTVALPVMPPAE
jgi:hypothetical protein